MNEEELESEYKKTIGAIDDFRKNVLEQLSNLIISSQVPLGINLESRVKDWLSIRNKIERKELKIITIHDISDLIGFRIILLFKRDLDVVSDIIKKHFDVISEEDKFDSLEDNKFGYQSRHYIIKVPSAWLKVPSFKPFKNYKAEIQLRTLSQHIWAATSHKLQYKNEDSVPISLRRALNRASALLEVVDLEFERILIGREGYVETLNEKSKSNLTQDEFLNVDSLKFIADKHLPKENAKRIEPYDELLKELLLNDITKVDQLAKILDENKEFYRKKEMARLHDAMNSSGEDWWTTGQDEDDTDVRVNRGVFFSHVGLIRVAVEEHIKNLGGKYRRVE
ncbi:MULTISPECIES: GTP pyrophosphokinase [Enterobacter]|uniref:GTP pyrophosphokinase n=1 Tax=Enterobacter TaxID=547 RepID=UPI001356E2F9|nr:MULTISPECIES: hypothetical protein [Enterobacter]HDR2370548.1 hypothetical protein [Enterobacter asburiae]